MLAFETELENLQRGYDLHEKVLIRVGFAQALKLVEEKFTSTNTGSPKLPSSTEVWNHVCENSPALRTVEQVEADRRVSKLVYEFIRRQLRAGT